MRALWSPIHAAVCAHNNNTSLEPMSWLSLFMIVFPRKDNNIMAMIMIVLMTVSQYDDNADSEVKTEAL